MGGCACLDFAFGFEDRAACLRVRSAQLHHLLPRFARLQTGWVRDVFTSVGDVFISVHRLLPWGVREVFTSAHRLLPRLARLRPTETTGYEPHLATCPPAGNSRVFENGSIQIVDSTVGRVYDRIPPAPCPPATPGGGYVKMCSGSKAGSYLRRIDFCITQL